MYSDEYQKQLTELHKTKRWGAGGTRHIDLVRTLIKEYDCKSVLDFGCGERTLGNAIMGRDKNSEAPDLLWIDYDPGIPHLPQLPIEADLVVCTHVLEHIEPEFLDQTISAIHTIANKVTYIAVPSGPANEWLPDGRNCHFTQQSADWWRAKLSPYGVIRQLPAVIFKNGRPRDETRFIVTL